MKKKLLLKFVLFICISSNLFAENLEKIKRISEGNENAKITIFTYESLTCGHCAKFHEDVYPQLKKEFIDTGLVKIEFRNFPLDIAALNASKIAHCGNTGESNILHGLFKNQKKWVISNNIDEINKALIKYFKDNVEREVGMDFEKCTSNKNVEDYVFNV